MAKPKAIRWTQERAAAEFGFDAKTVRKRLSAASVEPGPDGRYSTKQIAGALYGDTKADRSELVAIQTKRNQAKYRKEIGELIEISVVESEWEDHVLVVKGKLQSLAAKIATQLQDGLTQAERRDLIDKEVHDMLQDLSKQPEYNEPGRAAAAEGSDS